MAPKYVLLGAGRWLRLLPTSSVAQASALFKSSSEFADLTQSNYQEAYEWLLGHGLLDIDATTDSGAREAAFAVAVTEMGPSWLDEGIVGIPSPEFMPEPVLAAADALGVDRSTAWRCALSLGQKIDLERRQLVGYLGEIAIVEYLRQQNALVDHVALRADGYGWDVEATGPGGVFHMEVKATTSRARLRIYLSRNEFEVASRDPAWILVIAHIDREGRLLRVAHVPTAALSQFVPQDTHGSGRWQSCSIDFAPTYVLPSLPFGAPRGHDGGVVSPGADPEWWPRFPVVGQSDCW